MLLPELEVQLGDIPMFITAMPRGARKRLSRKRPMELMQRRALAMLLHGMLPSHAYLPQYVLRITRIRSYIRLTVKKQPAREAPFNHRCPRSPPRRRKNISLGLLYHSRHRNANGHPELATVAELHDATGHPE